MQLSTTLALVALVAAVMCLESRTRAYSLTAVAVAGLEVAMAFGVLSLSISGFSLALILGGLLVLAGAMIFGNAAGKLTIAASTSIVLIGALQVLTDLGIVRG